MTWNKNDFPIGHTVEGVEVRTPSAFGQATIEDELPASEQGGTGGPS